MAKKKSNREVVVLVVLLLLFSFSVFQFFEISELKDSAEGTTGYAKSTGQVPRASGNVPANLQNLPDMVGGC
jgi:hypothetical protein